LAELHHHSAQLQVLAFSDIWDEANNSERLLLLFREGSRLVE
jgi:hypothetical protein